MKKQKILWVVEHGVLPIMIFPQYDVCFSRSKARERKTWLVKNNPHINKINFRIVKFVREREVNCVHLVQQNDGIFTGTTS